MMLQLAIHQQDNKNVYKNHKQKTELPIQHAMEMFRRTKKKKENH